MSPSFFWQITLRTHPPTHLEEVVIGLARAHGIGGPEAQRADQEDLVNRGLEGWLIKVKYVRA